jgi:hypothetical protein
MKTRSKVNKMIKASKECNKDGIRKNNNPIDINICVDKVLTDEVDALKSVKDVEVLSKPKEGKVR